MPEPLLTPETTPQSSEGETAQGAGSSEPKAPDQSTAKAAGDGQSTPPPQEGGETQPKGGESKTPPDGDTKPDGESKDPPEPKAPTEYKLSAPEGLTIGDAFFTSFSEAARELDLSQIEAQGVLDKVLPELIEARDTQHQAWQEASKKVLAAKGGEGADANLRVAEEALKQFGNEELLKLVQDPTSGLGNHPGFIELLYEVGSKLKSDGFVGGDRAKQAPKSDADVAKGMFPKSAKILEERRKRAAGA